MMEHPEEQYKFASSSIMLDGTVGQSALATLKIQQNLTESELKHLLGTAFFSQNASIVLSLETSDKPLVITPLALTFLGRSENGGLEDVHINLAPYGVKAQSVSRLHAVLHRNENVIALEDLKSTNGTYVNGQRLIPHISQILHDNDEIMLGSLRIRISFQYG